MILDVGGARLTGLIGNLHAARVVQQHAEEVLLRDGRFDDQQRTEQADQDDSEQGNPNDGQHHAVARAATARPVRPKRQRDSHQHRDGGHIGARGGGEAKFPLAEHHRGKFEDKFKDGVEHE